MIKQEQRTPTSKHLPSLQVSVFLSFCSQGKRIFSELDD